MDGRANETSRAMGMRPIAIDGGEAKKNLCLSMGAEAFVDFTATKDVTAEVIRIADGVGAHGVLVTAYQAYKGKSPLLIIHKSQVQCN